jgi:hypothetical protein
MPHAPSIPPQLSYPKPAPIEIHWRDLLLYGSGFLALVLIYQAFSNHQMHRHELRLKALEKGCILVP